MLHYYLLQTDYVRGSQTINETTFSFCITIWLSVCKVLIIEDIRSIWYIRPRKQ